MSSHADALVESPRAAALDGLVRIGILRSWRLHRGPGNHRGMRRTWELVLASGEPLRVERGTLDVLITMANVAYDVGRDSE